MTWIKICGMTTPEAVGASLDVQVDAIGFVFAESTRRLAPDVAARLAAPARGRAACVAVMRHPTQAALEEVLALFRPDVMQTDAEDLPTLRTPEQLEVLPVYRLWQDQTVGLPARLVFEGPRSGAGIRSDWSAATRLARISELVLAGGLNAGNVAAAMSAVRPFGVDVSSGVEQRPGIKDPAEIARFVAAVRAQDSAIGAPAAPPEQERRS